MVPAETWIICAYNIRITQQFRRLGEPIIVIFPRAACELAYNKGCDPLFYNFWTPMSWVIHRPDRGIKVEVTKCFYDYSVRTIIFIIPRHKRSHNTVFRIMNLLYSVASTVTVNDGPLSFMCSVFLI